MVTVTKTKLVATASCVKPGLIYWPKTSDSRQSKQMPGIKNFKNNINVNVFTIMLFVLIDHCSNVIKNVYTPVVSLSIEHAHRPTGL